MMELPKLMLIARGRAPMVQLQEMWGRSGCNQLYDLVCPTNFQCMSDIRKALVEHHPAVIVIGAGFGDEPFTGDDLIWSARCTEPNCITVICASSELYLTAVHSKVDFRIKGSPEELRAALLTIRS